MIKLRGQTCGVVFFYYKSPCDFVAFPLYFKGGLRGIYTFVFFYYNIIYM